MVFSRRQVCGPWLQQPREAGALACLRLRGWRAGLGFEPGEGGETGHQTDPAPIGVETEATLTHSLLVLSFAHSFVRYLLRSQHGLGGFWAMGLSMAVT